MEERNTSEFTLLTQLTSTTSASDHEIFMVDVDAQVDEHNNAFRD